MLDLFSQLDWRAFVLAMFIVEVTPGPNMGWLAALSAQHGRKAGFRAVAGITGGLGVQMIAAAAGLSTVLTHFPLAYDAVRWAGVLFMLWLAWEAFADAGSSSPVRGSSSVRASGGDAAGYGGVWRGFVANVLNPKALVFYVAVVGQFADPALGDLWWQILILGSLHLAVAITVHMAIVVMGARFGAAFEAWRTSLWARLFFAGSLVLIALWIAVSTA